MVMLLVVFVLLLCCCHDVHSGVVSSDQIAGLQYFYNGTNGDYWVWSTDSNAGIPWSFSATFSNISNPCVNEWQGVQCTPNCSNTPTCNIIGVSLDQHNITGELPSKFLSLNAQLEVLSIQSNYLMGSLPSEIGLLSVLNTLNVQYNAFDGSILSYFNNVISLRYVNLAYNKFTGTIPSDFFSQQNRTLEYFGLVHNPFSGSVPDSIGTLQVATLLRIGFNAMTGTIPTSVCLVTTLQFLAISINDYSGSIPPNIGNLQLLTFLALGGYDLITGTIPSGMGTLSSMIFLHITGTFTGSFPPLASLNVITSLVISGSYMDIDTPALLDIVQKPVLRNLVLRDNMFSGDFAGAQFSPSLEMLQLSNNIFSGDTFLKLPSICNLSNLTLFSIDENSFSGSLPACMDAWQMLEVLIVNNNYFTGSLPSAVLYFSELKQLLVQSNKFAGRISEVLGRYTSLDTLVLSDNGFSGTLPVTTINSTTLRLFVASKNCFSGGISTELCNAISLETLAISGLAAANQCSNRHQLGIDVPGRFPACVFSMPKLTQLYAAGNGIRGSLSSLPPDSVLRNISLSFNRLSGTIPRSVQDNSNLMLLDLSFNRLEGTMEQMTDYVVTSSALEPNSVDSVDAEPAPVTSEIKLLLHTNHLSGNVPYQFTHATADIDVLSGNMFECKSVGSLPQTDPKSHKYACGSDVLDVCLGICALTVIVIPIYIGWKFSIFFRLGSGPKGSSGLAGWWVYCSALRSHLVAFLFTEPESMSMGWGEHDPGRDNLPAEVRNSMLLVDEKYKSVITYAAGVLSQFRRMVALLVGLIIVLFLPTNILFKTINTAYSSQTHQYAWVVSVAFLDGVVPGVLIAILWLVVIAFSVVYEHNTVDRSLKQFEFGDCTNIVSSTNTDTDTGAEAPQHDSKAKGANSFNMQLLIVLVNITISLLVNGVYVYVIITQSFATQILAVIFVSLFKLLWTPLVVIPWLKRVRGKFIMVVIANICNIVVVPTLAVMAVDLSCFQSSFVPQPPIVSEFDYRLCISFDAFDKTKCVVFEDKTISIETSAPVIYNNQCFAAVLTNYVPSFIITFGVIGVLVPFIQVLVLTYFSDSMAPGNEWKLEWAHWMKGQGFSVMNRLLPIETVDDLVHVCPTTGSVIRKQNLYFSRYVCMNCNLMLTLVMTFGVAFPPFAAILLINVCVSTLAFQLAIQHHYTQVQQLAVDVREIWLLELVDEVHLLHKILFGSRTAILLFSCLFAIFVIYDTTSLQDSNVSIGLIVMVSVITLVINRFEKFFRLSPWTPGSIPVVPSAGGGGGGGVDIMLEMTENPIIGPESKGSNSSSDSTNACDVVNPTELNRTCGEQNRTEPSGELNRTSLH